MTAYVVSDIGSRDYQEDTYLVDMKMAKGFHLVGVCDGHGGGDVSQWLETYYKNILNSKLLQYNDPKIALQQSILAVENLLPDSIKYFMGSTLNIVIRDPSQNKIWCCNIGDSRAIMNQEDEVIELSVDHKPNRLDETKRIRFQGGSVERDIFGTWRINKNLALSRAIGDKSFDPFVISSPEIRTFNITPNNKYICIASDGLWDVISNNCVVEVINSKIAECVKNKVETMREICIKLLKMAQNRKSFDNITIILYLL